MMLVLTDIWLLVTEQRYKNSWKTYSELIRHWYNEHSMNTDCKHVTHGASENSQPIKTAVEENAKRTLA